MKLNFIFRLKIILPLFFLFAISCNCKKNISLSTDDSKFKITVDTKDIISSYNKSMLLGTNTGVFFRESYYLNHDFINYLEQINPGILRMPGGSWSNELYWNGNKVRISKESYIEADTWKKTIENGGNPIEVAFDTTRYKNGKWDVDYSGYSPGFRIRDIQHHLSDYHGMTDVLFLHKFIQSFGCETMVTVNMGTGTVDMAVEWVKWTKTRKNYLFEPFDVKYWELGNELDGKWELGHYLEDGSEMDAKEYIKRYKLFTKAMKKADPDIKVGGSVASSMKLAFIEELIKDTDAPLDFVSFHAYPARRIKGDLLKMIKEAIRINDAVAKIKKWIADYRPDQKDSIEIAVTEWNIKVKEDISTIDLRNTLWSAVMIGEMAKAGVDIAIQWDIFSTKEEGGHGLFNPEDKDLKPHSQYWAMYLWNKFMGSKMVKTQIDAPEFIRVYATIENNEVSVMLINSSKSQSVDIDILFPKEKLRNRFEVITFSNNQYILEKKSLNPVKSVPPMVEVMSNASSKDISIAPYSIKVIKYKLDTMKVIND